MQDDVETLRRIPIVILSVAETSRRKVYVFSLQEKFFQKSIAVRLIGHLCLFFYDILYSTNEKGDKKMKIYNSFEDRKAHLTDECIEKCCKIATQGTAASFYVCKSAKSDSRYVYFSIDSALYVVRISDHMPKVIHFDRQIIVTPSTRNRKVVAALKHAVVTLCAKRMRYLLSTVATA